MITRRTENSNVGRCCSFKPLTFYRSVSTKYLTAMPVRRYRFMKAISICTKVLHTNMKIFLRSSVNGYELANIILLKYRKQVQLQTIPAA